ncbi:CvfB family protein [Mesohalobacter halotolerans]|uniref:GntR family transcriptional regulator n=1 Tax=Mesohalobacter halotolerans TaxID=1883405 RepID=A0A4U5TNN4_9FLAO|nr:S1-like domain-containing RNA-binding protein [Mesohalobacter halotolerans]TKS55610.1 GntR family transcriptional regulator [Mesohalobacter halotolerans]
MLTIGEYHTLIIDRDTEPGLFLRNKNGDEVLLPNKYKPESFEIGEELQVFVYLDHDERPVATTLTPKVKLDEFAMLKCVDVSHHGAFLDWGLEKHLFVPFAEQAYKMEVGETYLIFCFLDEESQRLVASSKVNHFVDNSILTVKEFDEVDLIVTNKTDLGYNMIINDIHLGLLYFDEVFVDYKTGDQLKGYIKKIRSDHKIDLTLSKFGYKSIEPNAQKIYEILKDNEGFLAYHDKSDPKAIYNRFNISKKAFKKAIGSLYKDKQIEILKGEGIRLKDQ